MFLTRRDLNLEPRVYGFHLFGVRMRTYIWLNMYIYIIKKTLNEPSGEENVLKLVGKIKASQGLSGNRYL